jgi:hypothetical protein
MLGALMTAESTSNAKLLELAQQTNDITNRLGGSAAGIAEDLAELKRLLEAGTVTPEALAAVDTAVGNLNAMSETLAAIDRGFPAPTPTPIPAPTAPTEVPPVSEAPGTEPIPA